MEETDGFWTRAQQLFGRDVGYVTRRPEHRLNSALSLSALLLFADRPVSAQRWSAEAHPSGCGGGKINKCRLRNGQHSPGYVLIPSSSENFMQIHVIGYFSTYFVDRQTSVITFPSIHRFLLFYFKKIYIYFTNYFHKIITNYFCKKAIPVSDLKSQLCTKVHNLYNKHTFS